MAWKTPQMTSAARTSNRKPGFTLIEIIMVLAIASVVMGSAIGMMIYSSDERALRDASGQIELLAKRARTTAILHQTSYALEFREGIVRLLPHAEAGLEEKKSNRRKEGPDVTSTANGQQVILDRDLALFIRRWNSEEWFSTTKNTVHVWRFDPDGLCEPVSIRLTLGKNSSEDTFHPLSATSIDAEKRLEVQ